MIRKFFSFLLVAVIISSCGNTGKKEGSSGTKGSAETVKVEFASLISNPADYIGKTISVKGKVVHVCMESGKKLFITGKNPDVRLYVQAGETMPKFPTELLGSEIVVEGTITKADAASMEGEEGMHSGEGVAKAAGTDSCETEKAMAAQPVLSDLMMIYNKHTVVK